MPGFVLPVATAILIDGLIDAFLIKPQCQAAGKKEDKYSAYPTQSRRKPGLEIREVQAD